MSDIPFTTLQEFNLGSGKLGRLWSLPALEKAGVGPISRLPVSIRIVLESVLRNCDGRKVTEDHVRRLANWQPHAPRTDEIPFIVTRILLQDFTGVPLLADLAAMRGAVARLGKNPKIVEPMAPVHLVVDHSVLIDHYGTPDALRRNMELEFQRNAERYQFMKWGMQAFDTFSVIPPGIGICHQINLEYLARGVCRKNDVYYPDTLVGTDSHTTMINGIGVVGWGVGGIEAEAGMLGQPIYFLTPDVVGVELTGTLSEGVTATDLVLSITEMLRKEKVVGKFVEFFGAGAAAMRYRQEGIPLIVFGGDEYGSGSSRDWAAKGTRLLGVRAVIARSFERIHRNNLVGMGVLPCQFKEGADARSLHLDGTESFDISGLEDGLTPRQDVILTIRRRDGGVCSVPLLLRLDTAIEVDYYRHSGILPFVLREIIGKAG